MKKLLLVFLAVVLLCGIAWSDDWSPPHDHPLVDVTVLVYDPAGGMGTGIVVSEDGYILTAAHVVSDIVEPFVIFGDGTPFRARVAYWSVDKDWCLLKINAPQALKATKVGVLNTMTMGDTLYHVGHPYGISWMVTKGILSGVKYDTDGYQYIFTDAAGAPGSSGGGLYNADFELIAIVQRGQTGVGHYGVGGDGLIAMVTSTIINDRANAPIRKYLEAQRKRADRAWKELTNPDKGDE